MYVRLKLSGFLMYVENGIVGKVHILKQLGPTPSQFSLARQVRWEAPDNVYPLLQTYVTVSPNFVDGYCALAFLTFGGMPQDKSFFTQLYPQSPSQRHSSSVSLQPVEGSHCATHIRPGCRFVRWHSDWPFTIREQETIHSNNEVKIMLILSFACKEMLAIRIT